jgi:PAS domain S-box-containing protein/diguanylate cyclase (GGDEF)-like protein
MSNNELNKYKPFINSDFFNMGPMVLFIWVNNASWSVEAVSSNLQDNFGYEVKNFISGKLIYANLIHKDDFQRVIDEVHIACDTKQTSLLHKPYRILNNNGEYRWVKDTTTIIYNEKREITHFVGYIIDITENEINLLKAEKEEQRLKTAQALAHIGNWELDLVSNELYWSDEIYKLFELDPKLFEPTYENFLNVIHPDDRKLVNDAYTHSLITKEKYIIQHRLLMEDGRIKYVEEQCESYFDSDGNPLKSLGTVQDTTQLKITERELKKTISLFESYKIAMDVSSMVSKTDLDGRITYVNEIFCSTSGYTKEELLGKKHSIVKHPNSPKEVFSKMWQTIQSKQVWNSILQNRGKNGDYWINSTIVPILDENDNIKEYIAVRHDITEIIDHQKMIEKLANSDSLTGFGNRNKLSSDIQKSLSPAIALINIDGFSVYNDFYGHTIGDEILVKLGNLIEKNNQGNFFSLYRLQGDEFALFNPNSTKEDFINYLEELLQNIKMIPIVLSNNESIKPNVTTAISFEKAPLLLQTVDMAYAIAKIENKEFLIYSEDISLNDTYKNNILWSNKIKEAIQHGRIVPYFQPIVNNINQKFEKYEALVRLIEEDGSVISPYFFLDISKKTKQYTTITKIMIEKSFEHFQEKDCQFSINLTMEDIVNDEINHFIFTLLEKYQIGSRVVFEIVESESIQNYESVSEFIKKLKSFGCKIAIDDFGSGYSNFEYILKLNVDYLKIDGSLIKNIVKDPNSMIIVSTIVNFAKQLGIKTIGEFVENEAIFKIMQELGIDYSQGYHFQAPQSSTNNE